MKNLSRWLVVVGLVAVYLSAFWAVLHPNVSQGYRAHFIERTSTDWNPPHYASSPEQGMNFSSKGVPVWVDYVYGFSYREDQGRWTDGDVAGTPGLRFTRSFKGPLCLEFTAYPASGIVGKSFAVQLGSQASVFTVDSSELAEFQAQFTEAAEGDRVSFLFSEQIPRESEVHPANPDPRRLGLKMISLRILPGTCSRAPQTSGGKLFLGRSPNR